MPESASNFRNKKQRRVVFRLVGLLAVFVAGGLVLGFIEKMRDAADRAT